MQLPQDAMLLRVFFGEQDRFQGKPLYDAIVRRARELHLAGATVLRGPIGYGRNSRIHRANLFEISQDLPIVVEIVDSEANIDLLLPELARMMGSGLVTLEKVKVIRYGDGSADQVKTIDPGGLRMTVLDEVLAANAEYVGQFGGKGSLALPPARQFAILTCMDARLDPAKYAGLAEGDAHVIRNAGGRATDDAIRSLVISHKLLGTRTWFVIHHTNCGMELFSDQVIADLLEDDLGTAAFDGAAWTNPAHRGGHAAGHFIKWHTIGDQERSVVQDVRRIREHPLVPAEIPIYAFVYDVRSGRLNEVRAASKAGRPNGGPR